MFGSSEVYILINKHYKNTIWKTNCQIIYLIITYSNGCQLQSGLSKYLRFVFITWFALRITVNYRRLTLLHEWQRICPNWRIINPILCPSNVTYQIRVITGFVFIWATHRENMWICLFVLLLRDVLVCRQEILFLCIVSTEQEE